MQTLTHPLEVASDVHQVIFISTDDRNSSRTQAMINENGEVAFECEIEVTHDYYGGDASVGDSYEFEVTGVTVEVVNVYDEDGQDLKVSKYDLSKIERLLEHNLRFEISKKY